VVDTAPALFVIQCSDRGCKDGGHDLTHSVMSGLRQGATHFEGEHMCEGQLGSSRCSSVMHYVATATYAE
jgi:hypothetical protein